MTAVSAPSLTSFEFRGGDSSVEATCNWKKLGVSGGHDARLYPYGGIRSLRQYVRNFEGSYDSVTKKPFAVRSEQADTSSVEPSNFFKNIHVESHKLEHMIISESRFAVLDEEDPDARPRLEKAKNDAIRFSHFWPDDLLLPSIGVAEDGEIVFEWRKGDLHAIAEFEGIGSFGYAIYQDGKFVPGKETGSISSNALPTDLETYLRG